MSNTGDLFESYVRYVYQTLLGIQGKNISVSRRATVYDTRGNSYNIDVFYEFDVAGVHHRVAIECKDHSRPVGRDDAIAFVGKIRDLPSAIGVFISRSGFQSGAKKYLQDHGVLHYSGDDLPHFGRVLASRIALAALPGESAVGQPFWTLMENDDGQVTGNWCLIPDPSSLEPSAEQGLFPLFYSRPHAELAHRLYCTNSPKVCVRGIEQPTLRFIILNANHEQRRFAILRPFTDDAGHKKFECEIWTAKNLARDYCMNDLSFDDFEREVKRFRK